MGTFWSTPIFLLMAQQPFFPLDEGSLLLKCVLAQFIWFYNGNRTHIFLEMGIKKRELSSEKETVWPLSRWLVPAFGLAKLLKFQ